ncbi:TonB-dependent receptor domain-containing protein [Rosenbergiella collisarenosi]|uniref:TonB-dependent receptor domain-containing protein n=1 Tax=Rosenbergiella collisarenosi TaxID=1544695 RepID=UPI001F4F5EAC|nr:TonB-dependent receptor [Rosenbergiella collisarenosi]
MRKLSPASTPFPTRQRLTAIALSLGSFYCSAASASNLPLTPPQQESDNLVVTGIVPHPDATNKVVVSAAQMQKNGSNDFGTLMRYQPLVGATGGGAGSGSGKSGFDRGGYTGYNIRGLESNRVGIDVDGVAMPQATGRPYAGRTGVNSFGIGRDYIDPYLFGQMDIEAGATAVSQPNTSIGGLVAFHSKSADDYLSSSRQHYFGYQTDYDSANRAWHNGITAAAGDDTLRGLFAYSRRDGQETRTQGNNQAWPENWHSDAFLASGIWQPNDEHKLTASGNYYQKTSHTHFDSWDSAGKAVLGTSNQSSQSRRFGVIVQDDYTPLNQWVDQLTSRVYWQKTQAHDNTVGPSATLVPTRTLSDFNTNKFGFTTELAKTIGRQDLRAGLNGDFTRTERPFSQSPAPLVYYRVMQPQADSQSETFGGFLEDKINGDWQGHHVAITPGIRVAYMKNKPRNLGSLAAGSSTLTEESVSNLYSSQSDTQFLPSLSLEYSLTPQLLTYIRYQRGAQFPEASQLYGSWNLGSSYAGTQQYALIGNNSLKTETSNNLEWGIKGQAVSGIDVQGSMFYNDYDNFIAYNRYTRSGSPSKFTQVPANIYTVYQAENRDKAFIYGGEVTTKIHYGQWFPAVNGLSSSFALGYTKGMSKSSLQDDKYVDLDSVAPMKAVVGVAWDDPAQRYGAALTATFVKGKQAKQTTRDTTNTGSATESENSKYLRIPGYGMVDMTAYWRVTPRVKLSGGVYNLTNRKYWDYLSSRDLTTDTTQHQTDIALATMPGRTFQLGLNVDF